MKNALTIKFKFGIIFSLDTDLKASSDDCATVCSSYFYDTAAISVTILNPCYDSDTIITETAFEKAHLEPYGFENALIQRIYVLEDTNIGDGGSSYPNTV